MCEGMSAWQSRDVFKNKNLEFKLPKLPTGCPSILLRKHMCSHYMILSSRKMLCQLTRLIQYVSALSTEGDTF